MHLQVKTPPTRTTAKCCQCGYGIYVENIPSRTAVDMFIENGWQEDEYGRPICPECIDEAAQAECVRVNSHRRGSHVA